MSLYISEIKGSPCSYFILSYSTLSPRLSDADIYELYCYYFLASSSKSVIRPLVSIKVQVMQPYWVTKTTHTRTVSVISWFWMDVGNFALFTLNHLWTINIASETKVLTTTSILAARFSVFTLHLFITLNSTTIEHTLIPMSKTELTTYR